MDLNSIDWRKANYKNLDRRNYESKPPIDREVSKIVGKTVLTNDPKLVKMALKWRGNKPVTGKEASDNYLSDPNKVKELKRAFN